MHELKIVLYSGISLFVLLPKELLITLTTTNNTFGKLTVESSVRSHLCYQIHGVRRRPGHSLRDIVVPVQGALTEGPGTLGQLTLARVSRSTNFVIERVLQGTGPYVSIERRVIRNDRKIYT